MLRIGVAREGGNAKNVSGGALGSSKEESVFLYTIAKTRGRSGVRPGTRRRSSYHSHDARPPCSAPHRRTNIVEPAGCWLDVHAGAGASPRWICDDHTLYLLVRSSNVHPPRAEFGRAKSDARSGGGRTLDKRHESFRASNRLTDERGGAYARGRVRSEK